VKKAASSSSSDSDDDKPTNKKPVPSKGTHFSINKTSLICSSLFFL
jgi:hypothetical protein